jgi:hypothetical protein
MIGGSLRVLRLLPPLNWSLWYSWNIAESGVKHNTIKSNQLDGLYVCCKYCRFVFLLSKMFLSVMHRCSDDRQRSYHAHCRVGDVLIIIDFTVTVKCRTAIKTLFLYLLNFCLSLNLESFSCSFTSIYFLSYNNSFSDNTYKLQLLLIGTVQKKYINRNIRFEIPLICTNGIPILQSKSNVLILIRRLWYLFSFWISTFD